MARTENQKAVTAYLSLGAYDQLKDFKAEQGLKSDSQAIAAILERFFTSPTPLEKTIQQITESSLKERLEQLERKISIMGVNWEITFNPVVDFVDKLDYRVKRLESTVPSTVEAEPLEESADIGTAISDVPSTVEATPLEESADIGTAISDVPSTVEATPLEESADIGTVISDVLSTVEAEPLEESADIGTVVSDVPSTVEVGESTLSSDSLFVICRFNNLPPANPKEFWYWDSSKKGFISSLDRAVKYKSLKVASKQAKKIRESEPSYADDNTAGWEIKLNTLEFFEQKESERRSQINLSS